MKKFLALLYASTLLFAVACGGGKETASKQDEGEDDEGPQQTASAPAQAGGTAAAPAAAPVAADAATITGVVKLAGAAPKMPAIQMSADSYCQSQHSGAPATDEEVVVGPGGELANVIVYVKNAPAGPPPSQPAELEQKGCQYHPHVQVVHVGQTINIKNDDSTLHNVHAMPNVNSQFNVGQPVQGMVTPKTFDKPELVPFKIKCDVHGWMKSYMAVLPHPYHDVSQMNGTFTIKNLPPGNYTLVAWHEKYGTQEQQVTVGAKESKQVTFTFKG